MYYSSSSTGEGVYEQEHRRIESRPHRGRAGAAVSARRMLVVGAHSADFVWRAGGAIAVCTAAGGEAQVVALSYGERGESGELWKDPGQSEERVKEIRHREAESAASALGAGF